MIEFDVSTLIDVRKCIEELATDFAHDHDIKDVDDFVDGVVVASGDRPIQMLFLTCARVGDNVVMFAREHSKLATLMARHARDHA